jgi:hypothetical protein
MLEKKKHFQYKISYTVFDIGIDLGKKAKIPKKASTIANLTQMTHL